MNRTGIYGRLWDGRALGREHRAALGMVLGRPWDNSGTGADEGDGDDDMDDNAGLV